jgi:hypothetical protein
MKLSKDVLDAHASECMRALRMQSNVCKAWRCGQHLSSQIATARFPSLLIIVFAFGALVDCNGQIAWGTLLM